MRNQDFQLVQISDSHCFADDETRLSWSDRPVFPNKSLKALLEHLTTIANDYEAILFTGDLAQEESSDTYQRLNEIFSDFPLKTYAIPGNHDIPEFMIPTLKGKIFLSEKISLKNWHILLLNTQFPNYEGGRLTEDRLKKLNDQLREVPSDEFVVLFMHHHPVKIQSEWLDKNGLLESENFWKLVELYPQVKAVFHGHIHQEFFGEFVYSNSRRVKVFGTPATCIQVKPRTATVEFDHTNPAWRKIVLRPDGKVETEVKYLNLHSNG